MARSINTEIAVFVCSHIFSNDSPILLVCHADEDWQFLCGEAHEGEKPRVVGLGHLVDRDPSLRELMDLPLDWEAERDTQDSQWRRAPILTM
jgi:hypothetical protein